MFLFQKILACEQNSRGIRFKIVYTYSSHLIDVFDIEISVKKITNKYSRKHDPSTEKLHASQIIDFNSFLHSFSQQHRIDLQQNKQEPCSFNFPVCSECSTYRTVAFPKSLHTKIVSRTLPLISLFSSIPPDLEIKVPARLAISARYSHTH